MIQPYNYVKNAAGEIVSVPNEEWDRLQKIKRAYYFLKDSQIPSKYHQFNLNNLVGVEKEIVDKLQSYVNNFRGKITEYDSLYFIGERNSGKTAAACAVGKLLIEKGYRIKFILARDLQDKLLKTQGYSSYDEDRTFIEKLDDYDMIIVDDVFDSKKTYLWTNNKDMLISEWDSFIRRAISNNIKLIFTSNISLKKVREVYGDNVHNLLSIERGEFKEYLFKENEELAIYNLQKSENRH